MNFPGLAKSKDKQIMEQPMNCTIGVLGAKGGVGATTIAVNLTFLLSKSAPSSQKVTLIDCNLQQPDAALMLSCQPEHSIVELLRRLDHLDEQNIEACCLPLNFSSEMRLLTPPLDGSAAASYTLTEIRDCLPAISKLSSINVLDIPNNLDKHLVSLLDACDLIVLVIEPNMTSIAAGKRWIKNFAELGYHADDLRIVINRVGGKLKYIENQANNSFPGIELLRVPSAYAQAENSAIEGIPMVLKSPKDAYAKAIQSIASSISARVVHTRPEPNALLQLQTV
ncbi:MAG: AAA family ATPase [Candidatus Melainabacteria bacterium]|nr:AAA family ATPase [Candidatus Melainabacteria bacterium]